MGATSEKDKFNLDSTYFVAFEMAHEALARGLAASSDLNIRNHWFGLFIKIQRPVFLKRLLFIHWFQIQFCFAYFNPQHTLIHTL